MNETLKILIVDDEVELCDLVAFQLESDGHQVFTAHGGDEAFTLILQQELDVVITDIRMPAGDGFTLLKRVRAHSPDLKVIIMSGFADVDENAAKGAGALVYLKKPLNLRRLSELLNRLKPA